MVVTACAQAFFGQMVFALNPQQLQSVLVLLLAVIPVALIWWAWLRLLR